MKKPILTSLLCCLVVLICSNALMAADKPDGLAALRAVEAKLKTLSPKLVECTVGMQIGSSRGSGIIVNKEGLILTAGHVCGKPNQPCIIVLPNGKTARGMTLGVFSSADAGMAKIITKGDWPHLEPGTEKDIVPGEWCLSAGHPGGWKKGRPPVVRLGRILKADSRVIQTDCPLIGGDSGGPLISLSGKVIGINSRIGANLTMNYHVPIGVFHDVWDRLEKAESWKDSFPEKNDSKVREAFRSILEKARDCVVQIKCENRKVVLGTVVGPDGWIITKASEIKPEPICCFSDGKELTAEVIGIDPRFDLAMLKVEAEKLPVIPWQTKTPDVGQIVAATGMTPDPLALGIISTPKRAIPRISGILGIMLKDGDGGVLIDKVVPGSPAEKAGIKNKDLITHLDGVAMPNRETLSKNIKKHRPGEKIRLTVKRNDKSLDVEATLGRLLTEAAKRHDLLNRSGLGVSRRADDFPLVVQHDTVLRPTECGTPLVDLNGKVVGLNIARAGRTESYCVPSGTLILLMYDLMSGRLKPKPVVPEKKAEPKKAEVKPEAKKPEAKPAPKTPEAKPEKKEPAPKTEPQKPEVKPEAKKPEAKPAPKTPEAKPEKKEPAPKTEPQKPEVKPEAKKPEAKPAPKTPEAKPEKKEPAPKTEPQKPEVKPEAKKPEPKPAPKTPEAKPEKKEPAPKAEPKKPEVKPEPKKPEAKPASKKPEVKAEKKEPAPKAEPKKPEVKKPEAKKPAPKTPSEGQKKQAA